jgi:hypothetical protein
MRLTKTILTTLILVCLLMPEAFWHGAAQEQHPSNCLKFGECELITCNPNGTYTYTFQVTNLSAFAATEAKFSHISPVTAVITPNPYPLSPALPPGQSRQITVTISGVGPGTLCFALSVHDEQNLNCCSEVNKCITLPSCSANPDPIACAAGVCCARAPKYGHTSFNGQKIAAVTGWSQNPSDPALTVFDFSGSNAFTLGGSSTPNNTPPKYNGPPSSEWTMNNLGSIFGVTIDHLGNIYVTASSAYNLDAYPQGPGRIYKIANGTGAISNFNAVPLPNSSPDKPALGNISFDCARKQIFVTNEEDGKIYRLDMNGVVVSAYDHGAPDNGAPGFAPLGERLWGVQVHNNRVYYSVVKEDCGHANSAINNEVWSVGINLLGDFDTGDVRKEVTVPDLPGEKFSSPISDISFSRDGRMLLAERTMVSDTTPDAHASRVLEYVCTLSGWTLTPAFSGFPYKYNVGMGGLTAGCSINAAGKPANSAGGVDYDYDPSATFGVWTTGDALNFSPLFIYGLQGFPLTGGTITNSALIDLDAQSGSGAPNAKTHIGDVEVSCPPAGLLY